jgi:hypothetical protein
MRLLDGSYILPLPGLLDHIWTDDLCGLVPGMAGLDRPTWGSLLLMSDGSHGRLYCILMLGLGWTQ